MPIAEKDGAESRESAAPEHMTARHKLVLLVLLGAQFMASVDFSILNVALPVIGEALGFGRANLQWIVTGFALPAAGFTLLFGRIGDIHGRRRLFLAGMALLGAGSLLGGLAGSPAVLMVARVAQGLAMAIATPAALSLLTTSFPEGPLRRKALGLNAAVLTAGFTVGSLLGGVLTGVLSWRWAFLINVPVAVIILLAAPVLLSETRNPRHTRLDVPGAVTVTTGLLALVHGVTQAERAGITSANAFVPLGIAVAALAAFWVIELRSRNPLVPMRVLGRRTVGWGNFGGFVVFAMGSAVVFLTTLYLQDVLSYSPMATGLAFTGGGVAAIIGGLVAPKLVTRFGNRAGLAAGLAIQGAGSAALLWTTRDPAGIVVVIAALAFAFFGHAYGITSYMVTATSGLPDHEQGLATGLTTLSQQIGLTMGIPVLSAVALAGSGLLSGIHLAVATAVAVNILAAALIGFALRRGAVAT